VKDTLVADIEHERQLNALQAAVGESRQVLERRMAVSGMSAALLLDMWQAGVRWYRDDTRVSGVIRQGLVAGASYVAALRLAQVYEERRLQKEGGAG
jgi:hypothetical protein